MKIKVGLIGFGRMGQMYWEEMQKSGRWDIAYICDTDPASRELARNLSPSSRIISDEQEIFDDQSVEAVGLLHWQIPERTNRKLSGAISIS